MYAIHESPTAVEPPTESLIIPEEERAAAAKVSSNIDYEIVAESMRDGHSVPAKMGEGRFAKVYKAWQRNDGQRIRPVAIKILHNTARYLEQQLFLQEILLLKSLSLAARTQVVNIIDVVDLGPMIMCGCGRIYHPLCPLCGVKKLHRRDIVGREYPTLACPDLRCGYQVSAQDIEIQLDKLISPPAKRCCVSGPHAQSGTIINFVDRPVMVMELQESTLAATAEHARALFAQSCSQFLQPDIIRHAARPLPPTWRSRQVCQIQRAMALNKLMLMVQLAEAVSKLHGPLEIVHKDLTPDNIMVNFKADLNQPVRMQMPRNLPLSMILHDAINVAECEVKIIDFGLADNKQLSRKWYEEKDIVNGIDKSPYFSPEALGRVQRISEELKIEHDLKRFVIPSDLINSNTSVHEGDVLSFQWDVHHEHDLVIKRIEKNAEEGKAFAYFEGRAPPVSQLHSCQLVMPLSEAHDLYSIGALYYYIFTEKHLSVHQFASFVSVLQTDRCELTAKDLLKRHGHSYLLFRDALPIPDEYWRDRVMEIILRAMVRGRRHSFNSSRCERGPRAAQDLLWKTKRAFQGFQQQIQSEDPVRRVRRTAWSIGLSLTLVLAGGLLFGLHQTQNLPGQQTTAPSTATRAAE